MRTDGRKSMTDRDGDDRSKLPLATSLPPSPDEAFDRFATLVRTVIGVPVALVSLVDQHRQVFPGASGLPAPWADSRTTPLSHSFCQHVVISAGPLVIADARLDPLVADNLAIPDLGVVAYAGMPLTNASGAVVGSLCAIDGRPREWTSDELALLSGLAAACSSELQLRDHAAAAAAARDRTRVLVALSEALMSATTLDEVSDSVAGVARDRLGAEFGGVTLLDGSHQRISYLNPSAVPGAENPDSATFAATAATPSAVAISTGQPQLFQTLAELSSSYPDLTAVAARTGGQTFAYLPLRVGAHPLGALAMMWRSPYQLDEQNTVILSSLAGYTAQAIYRAQLLAGRRDVARTMQEALLPVLPTVAGFELAGRYVAADLTEQVGGDWYDAFSGDGAQLTVSVGDVMGHDTAAAAAMGALRSALRALLIDSPQSPERMLARLDHVMQAGAAQRITTAILATLTPSPSGAELAWSNAGHLPPLLLEPGFPARFLQREADPILGLSDSAVRRQHSTSVRAGSTLLLFTDGLIERRGVDLETSLFDLRVLAEAHRHRPLEDLLDRILQSALESGHDDDTVLFGVRVLASERNADAGS
jgi:GAF domain-containing protein